jgi:hypothetical protein
MAEIAQVNERPESSQPIRRFPRLPEVVIAELDAMILSALARRNEVTLEIGRRLNEEKKVLGHGKFQLHFEETFASLFSLRTAERYMKKAKKADAALKIDSVSAFKPAVDRGAKKMRKATRQAQEEVDRASPTNTEKSFRHVHHLPLRMTSDEHEWTITLEKLPKWNRAERKVLRLLRALWIEYGIVSADDPRLS